MKTCRLIIFCLACLLFSRPLIGEATPYLDLKGFLGKEELIEANQLMETFQKNEERQPSLVLKINSSSGELADVLALAKTIHELKTLKQLKVIVYLEDNVVGPAAMLPFLGDEWHCSLFTSWGDIPLGVEGVLPTNILRNRVNGLIDNRHPQAPLLHLLADAMSDPSLQVVNDQGWKLSSNAHDGSSVISAPGQTLVINQNQLQALGLVSEFLTPQEFDARYEIKKETVSSRQDATSLPLVASSSSIEEKLKSFIHFNQENGNKIGYLYIGDHETAISQATWLYVKKALDYYKQNRPNFIILELDTPGGEVFAAQKISDALKEMDTQDNIPIIAFINNWAISAGAMLAYSCRFIAVVKDGSMGAAEPVYAGESGKMETASEKINSALRADFASRARFFDRSPLIAEAMVDKDMILVWRHGRVVKLDQENQIRVTGPDPDFVISPKGKLLTLSADELIKYGVADLLLIPEKLSPLTPEEKSTGQWPADKALLFQAPFFKRIPNATIDAYRMDWKTRFFVWLATPMISSLLLMGVIVGAYLEFNHPGLSLPGGLAATCLFLIVLSNFSLEIANWLELILLATGLILLLTELFILPSFGLFGIVGLILFIGGLFSLMLPGIDSVRFEYDTSALNAAGQYVMERLAWLSGALILSVGIILLIARYATPRFSGLNRFVLAGHEQDASRGFFAGEDPKTLPQPGTIGLAFSSLRPAGKISVEDQVYDALSAGDFIESGERIVVNRLEGGVIIVTRDTGVRT